LTRGKPLPPGIAKKTVPASMLGQLPYYPGYEWKIVGDNLVLIVVKGRLAISGQAMTPKTAFQAGVTGRTGPLNPPANKLRIIR
ncbi:anti-virulence regulator CigR family protein, partial [Salmonella enterica subsp. enterica serovar Kentucky]|nr:anti-virulence regulator CigR family protein [Salmonella enterica subsp. enterica serovar Kentucky]